MDERFLQRDELPESFEYPEDFHRLVEAGVMKLEPWWLLTGGLLRYKLEQFRENYPDRQLVPFAMRTDRDDFACWDLITGDISIVHEGASPGWESRGKSIPDFASWVHKAVDDLLEYW